MPPVQRQKGSSSSLISLSKCEPSLRLLSIFWRGASPCISPKSRRKPTHILCPTPARGQANDSPWSPEGGQAFVSRPFLRGDDAHTSFLALGRDQTASGDPTPMPCRLLY